VMLSSDLNIGEHKAKIEEPHSHHSGSRSPIEPTVRSMKIDRWSHYRLRE
jgi:hypothetical protein